MRRQTSLALLAIAALALLGGCVDRGRCLKWVSERRDIYVPVDSYGSLIKIQSPHTLCAAWEYPEGKPA